jgi:hypothetical protein
MKMNETSRIEALFTTSPSRRLIHKYSNYFEVYERYLAPLKDRTPSILEIGVQHGGSLLLWDNYFEGKATIYGMDILPECKKFEGGNIRIFIGDQSDEAFLADVVRQIGKVDIIIDDGSHIPAHQIASFEALFYQALAEDGVYICEDCHTSYWPRYGGGLRRSGTFIEYAKRLCDQLNAWVADNPQLKVNDATRWIKSVSFFSSVVVIEKAQMTPPKSVAAGDVGIDLQKPFKDGRFSRIIVPLKGIPAVQSLVRRSPFLWRLLRKLLQKNH